MFKFGFELRKCVSRLLVIALVIERTPASVHRTVLFNSKEAVDHSFSFKVRVLQTFNVPFADAFDLLDSQLGMASDYMLRESRST